MIFLKVFIIALILGKNTVLAAEICIFARAGKYKVAWDPEWGPNIEDWGHTILTFKDGQESIIIQNDGSKDSTKELSYGQESTKKILHNIIKSTPKSASGICYTISEEEVKKLHKYIEFDTVRRVYKATEYLEQKTNTFSILKNNCTHLAEEIFEHVTGKNAPVRAFQTPLPYVSALPSPKTAVRKIRSYGFFYRLLAKKGEKPIIYKDSKKFYKYFTGEEYQYNEELNPQL